MTIATTHRLTIDRWHPPRINEWDGYHWSRRAKLKRSDRDLVAVMGLIIPRAEGKRRVSLVLTLAPRQRGGDPDAYWKSLLDALTTCGLLVDDSRQWCELGTVEFERGQRRATEIVLEDMTC